MKNIIFLSFLMVISSDFACQYHGKPLGPISSPLAAIYDANKLPTLDDVQEYQSLLHACKIIKSQMVVIADHRLLIEDAVETSITLYLEGVKGNVAKILLEDIRKNGFQL